MPIRDIQHYTELIHQGKQTAPERLQLLLQHRKRVEAHRLEIEQHLAAITTKIACYEHEFVHPQSVTDDEDREKRSSPEL